MTKMVFWAFRTVNCPARYRRFLDAPSRVQLPARAVDTEQPTHRHLERHVHYTAHTELVTVDISNNRIFKLNTFVCVSRCLNSTLSAEKCNSKQIGAVILALTARKTVVTASKVPSKYATTTSCFRERSPPASPRCRS